MNSTIEIRRTVNKFHSSPENEVYYTLFLHGIEIFRPLKFICQIFNFPNNPLTRSSSIIYSNYIFQLFRSIIKRKTNSTF